MGWNSIDEETRISITKKAHEYIKICKGKNKISEDADLRSSREIQLVNEIVEAVQPYLRETASTYLNGAVRVEFANRRTLELSGINARNFFTVDDLVNQASLTLIQKLHQYNPKFCFSTFLCKTVPSRMHKYVKRYSSGISYLPHRKIERARKQSNGSIIKTLVENSGLNYEQAELIALAILENHFQINHQAHSYERKDNNRKKVILDYYLRNKLSNSSIRRTVDLLILEEEMKKLIKNLENDEQEVINCRFFCEMSLKETGKRIGKWKSGVMRIQNRALKKLRQNLVFDQGLVDFIY